VCAHLGEVNSPVAVRVDRGELARRRALRRVEPAREIDDDISRGATVKISPQGRHEDAIESKSYRCGGA